MYLSHGGWNNETAVMGTDKNPGPFKNVVDNAIVDGKIKPLIIVMPTYNNTSDSGSYSLALQLTDQFHNELINDLIPAAESKYSTYAESTTPEGLAASRDHRGFGGFLMGSVNTWCTFSYCFDYFRYFMPMTLECRLVKIGEDGHVIGEIVNVSADESVLGKNGLPDAAKLQPISFDPVNNAYLVLGEKVGSAFSDGNPLK